MNKAINIERDYFPFTTGNYTFVLQSIFTSSFRHCKLKFIWMYPCQRRYFRRI